MGRAPALGSLTAIRDRYGLRQPRTRPNSTPSTSGGTSPTMPDETPEERNLRLRGNPQGFGLLNPGRLRPSVAVQGEGSGEETADYADRRNTVRHSLLTDAKRARLKRKPLA